MQVGDFIIAKTNKQEAVVAGYLYVIESINHHALGECGLIKLKDVRDYWNSKDFVLLDRKIIDILINQNIV